MKEIHRQRIETSSLIAAVIVTAGVILALGVPAAHNLTAHTGPAHAATHH